MLTLKENTLKEDQFDDILLKYQQKGKVEKEIVPNMPPKDIADIISDKLIKKIQESLKTDASQADTSQKY